VHRFLLIPICAFLASFAESQPLRLPKVGEGALQILSPTLLDLTWINTKPPGAGTRVENWDFVDSEGVFHAPSLTVTVDGRRAEVKETGFKRRPLYAPLAVRDLRIENHLYLRLAAPVAEGRSVSVTGLNGDAFAVTAAPLRYSPAIHVNQEGYTTALPKIAMVGAYIGSLGELEAPAAAGFSLVDLQTGRAVFKGKLGPRPDAGFTCSPIPYQQVCEADFSAFRAPGVYKMVVPGLGASLPFVIDDSLVMGFARAYAIGLYNQRCGSALVLPFTRHVHPACHTAPADVPVPQSAFAKAWANIASENGDCAKNPRHTAPRLKDEASQLYPFVRTGKIDVSGGHHDAGDYGKYTTNSARFIHYLAFAADALPGAGALDNLGIPESGDGRSDLLQEAKIEADFLAKMQDADGGFYFLVYPRDRKYENDVLPERGDSQIVFPKTTAATAAAVAALAELSSSPLFKSQFPEDAARYLRKARLGWKFLMDAIAAHGKDGAYQKITHYGDEYMHDDELAWAACGMFLATGDTAYERRLMDWYDPEDRATRRWTWQRLFEGYGCACRDYAFAARSGRLPACRLDAHYLAKCETELLRGGDDVLLRSQHCAYGTAFDSESKRAGTAGWYFSSERAFDMTVAYQLDPKPDYIDAILTNLNFEGGCNPVNVTFVTGLGWRRQREIVHQYAQNDRRVLPPSGLPLGNLQQGFAWLNNYGKDLGALTFPPDGAALAPYAFYDRWGDSFNTSTEFVAVDQARSLASLAFLAARTPAASQTWRTLPAAISAPPGSTPAGAPVTVTLDAPGFDLGCARIVWEAADQEPVFGGSAWTFTPASAGRKWIEVEAALPDGRRVAAAAVLSVRAPTLSLPGN